MLDFFKSLNSWSKINMIFYFIFLAGLITLIVGGIIDNMDIITLGCVGVFTGAIIPVLINTLHHFLDKLNKKEEGRF